MKFIKQRTQRSLCFSLLLATLFLTACASKVPLYDANKKPIDSMDSANKNAQANGVNTVDVTQTQGVLTNAPQPSIIYFDINRYNLSSDAQIIAKKHGDFLNKNPGQKVVIQGHTDDRGTSEYNLALGQRRAESAKQAMMTTGDSTKNIEVVSFGKEKPAQTGQTEEAYSKNRRSEWVYSQ